MTVQAADLRAGVEELAAAWRADRRERQARTSLDRRDFDALREAGFLRSAVPVHQGGGWRDAASSTREVCEVLRRLAGADPSVALVASMHPAVLAFWLTRPDPSQPTWVEQRDEVFASAAAGLQWGTITSEPGSGGDIGRTKAVASPTDEEPFLPGKPYAVSGDKHFGSGSGVTDRMITTAVPAGEADPTIFVLDVRDRPWDGSAGLRLTAEWDGVGMAATQSHAMRLEAAPAVRLAYDGPLTDITRAAAPVISSLFTAVVLGALDEAVTTAAAQLRPRADQLRPYEQVEWSRARQDHWLAVQAFEGALRAVEGGDAATAFRDTLRAKQAVAELAEATLVRISRVVGGGTFSRRSPFAHWFEDVRALGFLRPPWGLAYDTLLAESFGDG